PPERLTLAGEGLRWKGCAQCPTAPAAELKISADRGQLRVKGDALPRPGVFVSGTYKLHAEGQPAIEAAYPLELRAEQERIVVVATMPLEDYVSATLAGESGNFKQLESMKAMAIAV